MITSILGFFVQNGWLTRRGKWILFCSGWVFMLLPFWLVNREVISFLSAFFIFCLGSVFGLVLAYDGKAKQFGYSAPFTNDPLGWRAAKKSYGQDPAGPAPETEAEAEKNDPHKGSA
jgi:hypothetical protein